MGEQEQAAVTFWPLNQVVATSRQQKESLLAAALDKPCASCGQHSSEEWGGASGAPAGAELAQEQLQSLPRHCAAALSVTFGVKPEQVTLLSDFLEL